MKYCSLAKYTCNPPPLSRRKRATHAPHRTRCRTGDRGAYLREGAGVAVVAEALAVEDAEGAAGRVALVDEVADVLVEELGHLGWALVLARRERGLGDIELESRQLALLVGTLALVDRALRGRHRLDVVRIAQVEVRRLLHIGQVGQHLVAPTHPSINTSRSRVR
jgi:hypothetical protein